jgi:signal transduction histidine kinase
LLNAEEEERRRLSRELHDTLGQHLVVLSLGLKAVEADGACAASIGDRVRQLSHTTRQLEDEIDRLAYMLRPIELDSMGLADALTQYAHNWSATSGVAVDVQMHGLPEKPLLDAVDTTVYRVVQEALTNVSRHAGASRVSLVIERRGKELRVIVEDDGRGFDPESPSFRAQRRSGLGLRGMAERAALLSGRLQVESMPGKGSTVYLSLPIEPSDAELAAVASP